MTLGQRKEKEGTLEQSGHQPSRGAKSHWRDLASNNKEGSA